MLRRKGLNIDDFAYSIRLKQYLNEIGLKDEKLEDFARHLEVHCFKGRLTPDTFMNLVANISYLSDKLGDLPERIKKSKERLTFSKNDSLTFSMKRQILDHVFAAILCQ